ncbi:M56 family metallopeptidase, partial [Armatimonas sp.]|uniref:M56 family metallopeptidase n=1 Tax=Armatimonas sp. TaxID=1872638 RepID=UPI00286B1018
MKMLLGTLLLSALLLTLGRLIERFLPRRLLRPRVLICRLTLVGVATATPLFVLLSLSLPAPQDDAFQPTMATSASVGFTPTLFPTPIAPRVTPSSPVQEKPVVKLSAVSATTPTSLRPPTAFPTEPSRLGEVWSMPVYLAGMALGLCWLAMAGAGIMQLCRASQPVECEATFPAPVRLSTTIKGVALVGIRQPLLLLTPSFFTCAPELQRAILRHEAAHLRHHDLRWNLAFRIAAVLLWPVPLVGLLRRAHEAASEELADALAVVEEIAPRDYARGLVELSATHSGTALALGISSPGSQLKARVQRLLSGADNTPLKTRTRLQIAVLSVALALPLTMTVAQAFGTHQENHWLSDSRLNVRLSINAEGIALSELLPQLGTKTGVTLTVRAPLSEDKVVVFSKDRTLRETLDDLAALFGASWRETKSIQGQPTYRLELPTKTRRLEERLEREDRRWILEKLDALVKQLRTDPEKLAATRLAVELYARLTPDQKERLAETHHVKLPVAGLTAKQRLDLAPLFYKGERFKDQPKLIPSTDGSLALDGITPIRPDKMERVSVVFDLFVFHDGIRARMAAPTGLEIPMHQFPAPEAFALPPHGNPYDGAKVDEKALSAEVKVSTEKALVERLKVLAELSGQPVFADLYRSHPVHVGSKSEIKDPQSAVGKLDALCQPEGYLWWTANKTLLFRKRDWYRQRRYEVSDAWRETVARQLKQRGGKFIVADLLPLAELSLEQLVGLSDVDNPMQAQQRVWAMPEALRLIVAGVAPQEPITQFRERPLLVNLAAPQIQPLWNAFQERYLHQTIVFDINPAEFGFLCGARVLPDKAVVELPIYLQPKAGNMAVGGQLRIP